MYQLFRVDMDIWGNLQYTLQMFLKYLFVFLTKLNIRYLNIDFCHTRQVEQKISMDTFNLQSQQPMISCPVLRFISLA